MKHFLEVLIVLLFSAWVSSSQGAEGREIVLADFEQMLPCSECGDPVGFRRVDTLFATDEPEAWGQYDAAQYRVEVHPHREPEDIELMNAAVLHTLQAGGTVYIDDADALPDGTPIAALLRY